MAESYRIYSLRDPRDSAIRYVGCTASTLALRLSNHINNRDDSPKGQWIADLLVNGLRPLPNEEAIVRGDKYMAECVEGLFIEKYLGHGRPLLNRKWRGLDGLLVFREPGAYLGPIEQEMVG